MDRTEDVTSCTWGHAPELAVGIRVVVWPASGKLYPGTVEDGPRAFPRRAFLHYRVRPTGGRARWLSCISLVSAVLPGGRLPP